jgi:hypothetical protein
MILLHHSWAYIWRNISQPTMLIPAHIWLLFTIAKLWSQSRWPTTDKWIKKVKYVNTIDAYIYNTILKIWNYISYKKMDRISLTFRPLMFFEFIKNHSQYEKEGSSVSLLLVKCSRLRKSDTTCFLSYFQSICKKRTWILKRGCGSWTSGNLPEGKYNQNTLYTLLKTLWN